MRVLLLAVLVAGAVWGQGEAGRPRLVVQTGHTSQVTCGKFSADSKRLVTGSADGYLRLWEVASGRELARWRVPGAIADVALVAGGLVALVAGPDLVLRVFDVEAGRELRSFRFGDEELTAAALAPAGRSVLIGLVTGEARLLDVGTGRLLQRLVGHRQQVTAVAFSPDGRMALTGSAGEAARLWNLEDGRELRRLGGDALTVAFTPDARWVVTGGQEGIALWDAGDGSLVGQFAAGIEAEVAISADGRWLLTTDELGSGSVLWDVASGQERWRCEVPDVGVRNYISCLSFSPDGRTALTGSGNGPVSVGEVAGNGEQRVLTGDGQIVWGALFSPDGQQVATGGEDGLIQWWDLRTGRILRRLGNAELRSGGVEAMALSPSGQDLLVSHADACVRLWDSSSGHERWRTGPFVGPDFLASQCQEVGFSRDGAWALYCGPYHATLVRAATGEELRGFWCEEVTHFYSAAALRPDGQQVATGHADGLVRLWNAADGTLQRTVRCHAAAVLDAAYAPDGRRLLTCSSDGVGVWDPDTGGAVERFADGQGLFCRVGYSPNGQRAAAATFEGELWLWEPGAQAEPRRVNALHGAITSLEFSPDSSRVLTASDDGSTRLWSAATGRELCALYSFTDGTWAVVAPDGRFDTNNLEDIKGLHWVMPDDPFHALPLEIFMRDYYEPRLLPRLLAGEAMPPVRNLLDLNRRQPEVRIVAAEPAAEGGLSVTVEVTGAARKAVAGQGAAYAADLRLFRDGQLVGWADGELPLQDGIFRQTFPVRIPRREGLAALALSAYCFNDDRVKSNTARLEHELTAPPDPVKGRAYVVTVGVDAYSHPGWASLSYAVADATATQAALAERLRATGRYREVVGVSLLADGQRQQAAKAAFQSVLGALAGSPAGPALAGVAGADQLQAAQPEDLVVLAWSGHGYAASDGTFYLLPSDLGTNGDATGPEVLARAVSSEELSRWLRGVDAGDLALIIDACHSAASVEGQGFKPGPMGSRGLGQLAYDKGMAVLAASQAAQPASESSRLGHGLLTYALVPEGLEAQRAASEGRVTLAGWLQYGVDRVPALCGELADGTFQPVKGAVPVWRPGQRDDTAQRPGLFSFRRNGAEVVLAEAAKPVPGG